MAPSGVVETEGKISNCIYIFHRSDFSKPIALIPTDKQATSVVRFSNRFYKLRNPNGTAATSLPYRMVFAVATLNTILVCDTETFTPFAVISDAHYARISDLTWSPDNNTLLASSTDGYCSFIFFEGFELGEKYDGELPHLNVIGDVIRKRRKARGPKKKGESIDDQANEKKDLSDVEQEDIDEEMMDDEADNVNLDETRNSGEGQEAEEDRDSTPVPTKTLPVVPPAPTPTEVKPKRRITLTTLGPAQTTKP